MPWVVSVTYGKRRELMLQMIAGVRAQGVERLVIVNNGANWNLSALKNNYPELIIEIVEMGSNLGSAAGYAAGIQRAVDGGAELIWLMDDDNKPREQCLQALLDVYRRELIVTARDRLTVLAFRPEHQANFATPTFLGHAGPRPNSFRGFHFMDLPFKLWRRTPWGRSAQCLSAPEAALLVEAPYSGLLFHKDVVTLIGLPDSDYVLYADDYEFTHRIVQQRGGRIALAPEALQDDLEASWNVRQRFNNGFAATLCGSGDFRAYYGMRNGVHYDIISRKRSAAIFWINRMAYMALLFVLSRWYGKRERFRLLRDAARDGLSGRLGVNERYPL